MKTKEKRIQHYSSSQKILLVGEGDFSFSACLARAFGSAVNMIATSLDSEDTLLTKHQNCEDNLDDLEERGCVLLHEVDVHNMNKHPKLIRMKFDVIIFNFPHAGHFQLYETNPILIEKHKKLLGAFFRSASGMLKEDGEVHVTHRDDYPYNQWEVEKLAQKESLVLKEKAPFVKQNYPGYHNKRGSFINGNKSFPIKDAFTFKFSLDCPGITVSGTCTTVSSYNHKKRDNTIIQSNQKFTLEAKTPCRFFLDHQGTTLTNIYSNNNDLTLNEPYTSMSSLGHQGTTLKSTSNKNVTLKDPYTSMSSLGHQGTTLKSTSKKNVTLKDPYTSKPTLDQQQTTLMSTSNKNVTLKEGTTLTSPSNKSVTPKDPYTSMSSLDHQGTTLKSTSNKNVTLKNLYTSMSSLDQQGTTLTSTSNKNVTLRDPYTSKSTLDQQQTTLKNTSNGNDSLNDLYTSKSSLNHQGMTLDSTSNKNVTLKDSYTSNYSLGYQQTTLGSSSNRNVTAKDPYTSKQFSPYQETTLTSTAISPRARVPPGQRYSDRRTDYHEETYNISFKDYVGDAVREILAFFQPCAEFVFGLLVKLAIATFFIFFIFHISIILEEDEVDL